MKTLTAEVLLNEQGFIHVKITPKARQSLEDAQANLAAAISTGNGMKRPLLTDIRYCLPLTPEARRYYSGRKLVDSFTALALLIDSTSFGRTMGNIYLQIAKPGIPTRLFTAENQAIEWLKGHVDAR